MDEIIQNWRLKFYETLESTMDEARNHLAHGTIIWAKKQTKGRGRYQRPWISLEGNLLCSFILAPQTPYTQWPQLAFVSAIAVGESLIPFLKDPSILSYKWPNDILLEGKKVAGILLEIQDQFMIVGIGVNLVSSVQGLAYPTTSLKDVSTVCPNLRTLLINIADQLQKNFQLWQDKGFSEIRKKWLGRAHYLGQKIVLKGQSVHDQEEKEGLFHSITDNGSLNLQRPHGEIDIYHTGDVFAFNKDNQ